MEANLSKDASCRAQGCLCHDICFKDLASSTGGIAAKRQMNETVSLGAMHRQETGYQNAELHSVDAAVEGQHEGAFCLLALVTASLHEHLAQALPVQVEGHLCHCLVGFSHLLEPIQSRASLVISITMP